MVFVAQLVRALDCGSRSHRFESDLAPMKKKNVKQIKVPYNWHVITKEEQERERIKVYKYII